MGKKKGQGNHHQQASSSTVWRAADGGRSSAAKGKAVIDAFADGSEGRFESLPAGYTASYHTTIVPRESSRRENSIQENADNSSADEMAMHEEEESNAAVRKRSISVRLCMWEFGQNDPKRDSGVKLRRMGFADSLKIGQSFPGNNL